MASLVRGPLGLAIAVFALVGCGYQGCAPPDPDDSRETQTLCDAREPPADGAETVELGDTSSGELRPFDTDATLVLQHGPQGGQHVYVSVALYAKEPGKWMHTLTFEQQGALGGSSATSVDACALGWTVTQDARVVLQHTGSQQGTITVKSVRQGDTPDHALVDQVNVSILDE